jgi:hypothetical protein
MKCCPECGLIPKAKRQPWGKWEVCCAYRFMSEKCTWDCWSWAVYGNDTQEAAEEAWDKKLSTWTHYDI